MGQKKPDRIGKRELPLALQLERIYPRFYALHCELPHITVYSTLEIFVLSGQAKRGGQGVEEIEIRDDGVRND